MSPERSKLFQNCLRMLLKPIVGFCIRNGLTIQTLLECSKVVFIESAAADLEANGQKVNVSRLSVATGLHRRDVMRIYREGNTQEESASIPSRVIGQWEQDSRFLTKAGKPRMLSLDGDDSEFRQLVKLISSDVNSGTILFELERTGAVERVGDKLKLCRRALIISENPEDSFRLLSEDAEDLVASVEQNVFSSEDVKNLHARTEYDNIAVDDLPAIRKWLLDEGSKFHARARKYLAQFDLDIAPREGAAGGGRVVVGTFGRAQEAPVQEIEGDE